MLGKPGLGSNPRQRTGLPILSKTFAQAPHQVRNNPANHLQAKEALTVLQQTKGNQYVARQLKSVPQQDEKTIPVQRQADDEATRAIEEVIADPDVPGLTVAVAKEINQLIANRQRQEALNVLIEFLDQDGQIDQTLLQGGRMGYSRGVSGEGVATPPGYNRDPATGERRARPTPVRIGPAAFRRGLTWLYTSVLHEYQHVQQFQQPGAKGTTGQRALGWLIERQEVEAYATEILNSRTTGLYYQPRLMRITWGRLHNDHWLPLGRKSRRLLNDLYVRAHTMAQEAVGEDIRLPFRPAR
ncbi:MAG: hypothetical protein KC592_16555 [Nitrospira sp.]|nr:hypothetical protein [Nitrospira sp.]